MCVYAGPTVYGQLDQWTVYRIDERQCLGVLRGALKDSFSDEALRAKVAYGRRHVKWNDLLGLMYTMNSTTEKEQGVDLLRLDRADVINLGL